MKDQDKVKSLIALLKSQATTDFEMRRIETLEKDLFEPPKPEIIDENLQRFDDFVFRNHKGHFSRNFGIHQVVWKYYFGEIPDGYEIHHIDQNKANNNIENLQMLSHLEHRLLHAKNEKMKKYVCEWCGKEYESRVSGKHRFCSAKCQSAFYYRTKTETRICEFCGCEYETHKYHRQRFCSTRCLGKYTAEKRFKDYVRKPKNPTEKRICAICGKEFTTRKYRKTKTCSPHCAGKLTWQNKKKN